jgi:hypothetical protein
LAGTTGFEPATFGLTGRRTLQTVLRSQELTYRVGPEKYISHRPPLNIAAHQSSSVSGSVWRRHRCGSSSVDIVYQNGRTVPFVISNWLSGQLGLHPFRSAIASPPISSGARRGQPPVPQRGCGCDGSSIYNKNPVPGDISGLCFIDFVQPNEEEC